MNKNLIMKKKKKYTKNYWQKGKTLQREVSFKLIKCIKNIFNYRNYQKKNNLIQKSNKLN